MKTRAALSFLFRVMIGLGAAAATAAENEPGAIKKLQPVAVAPVRFLGYLGERADPWFLLETRKPDGEVELQRAKLGGSVRGYTLKRVDLAADNLFVENASGQEIILHLVDAAKIKESGSFALTPEMARKTAFELAEAQLALARKEPAVPGMVVDVEIEAMTPTARAIFLKAQERLSARGTGQVLIAWTLPDGRGGQTLSSNDAAQLPAEVLQQLSAEDRARYNRIWAVARAEKMARSIPPKAAPPAEPAARP
jgi:hypothetical protein